MSADELNTLRAEAVTMAVEQAQAEIAAQAPEPPPAVVLSPVDEGFARILGTAAGGVGNILCRRLNVTGMDESEAASLGAALERLVAAYDIGPKDPKGQAWMGLGLVMLGVVGNRRPLPPKEAGETAVPVPVEVPPPPVFGAVPQSTLGAVSNP
ncbi:MAG: hypothetical protein ACM3Q1_05935 [Bacteroidales bacterium]